MRRHHRNELCHSCFGRRHGHNETGLMRVAVILAGLCDGHGYVDSDINRTTACSTRLLRPFASGVSIDPVSCFDPSKSFVASRCPLIPSAPRQILTNETWALIALAALTCSLLCLIHHVCHRSLPAICTASPSSGIAVGRVSTPLLTDVFFAFSRLKPPSSSGSLTFERIYAPENRNHLALPARSPYP